MRRFLIGLAGLLASATIAANAYDNVIESEEDVLNPVVACRNKDDFLTLYRSPTNQRLPDIIAAKLTSGECVTLLKNEVVRVKINPPITDFLQATRQQDGADYFTYVNAFTRRWAEKKVLVPVLACKTPGAFYSYHQLMTHARQGGIHSGQDGRERMHPAQAG